MILYLLSIAKLVGMLVVAMTTYFHSSIYLPLLIRTIYTRQQDEGKTKSITSAYETSSIVCNHHPYLTTS